MFARAILQYLFPFPDVNQGLEVVKHVKHWVGAGSTIICYGSNEVVTAVTEALSATIIISLYHTNLHYYSTALPKTLPYSVGRLNMSVNSAMEPLEVCQCHLFSPFAHICSVHVLLLFARYQIPAVLTAYTPLPPAVAIMLITECILTDLANTVMVLENRNSSRRNSSSGAAAEPSSSSTRTPRKW